MAPKPKRKKQPGIWDGLYGDIQVKRVQPYEALKAYVCPGCNRGIPEKMGHYVCVPTEATDLRRHWHYACWDRRAKVAS